MTAHPPYLHTGAEIALARERLRKSPAAHAVAKETLERADRWAAMTDEALQAIVPPPEVPRAFNTSFDGCPIHGRSLFDHGNYSWRFDPFTAPWKLVCPIGNEVYPSNDFAAFLAGDMQDRSLLTGPFADDGWGWPPPGGTHRHWFVAYYCHWLWLDHIIPATLALARAFLLTGAERYAHKAGVLLARIARDYPRMDINSQSRYAKEFVPTYTGKIVNAIWETAVARDLAEAWDAVGLAVSGDSSLGSEVVALVEVQLLREALRAIPERHILGNYGMHQQTAVYVALALGDPTEAVATLEHVLHGWPDVGGFQYEGMLDVLDNLFFAEGLSFETAPGYCTLPSNLLPTLLDPLTKLQGVAGDPGGASGWRLKSRLPASQVGLRRLGPARAEPRGHPLRSSLAATSVAGQTGPDLSHATSSLAAALPRLTALVSWPERLVCLDRWTPAIGDSGGASVPAIVDVQPAARRAMARHGNAGAKPTSQPDESEERFTNVSDLFAPPGSLQDWRPTPPPTSDVLTDYGLAILRSGQDRLGTALTLHYGRANASHAHADRLNVEFFGAGRSLLPDLGYPQFAAEDKTAQCWDRNTGSHAVVVVDGRRQQSQNAGRLELFARSDWLQVASASAHAYAGMERYERTVALIGDGRTAPAYAVDLFHVRGGACHDYHLHGPDLPCEPEGLEFGDERPGTLAGPDVPFSALWDDLALDQPEPARPLGTYEGCGDSFLYGVREAMPGDESWSVRWGDEVDGLRVHILPADLRAAYLAWGDVPHRPGNPRRLRHLILRREGAAPIESRFFTALEPLVGGTSIRRVERLSNPDLPGVAVRIQHADGSDLVLAAEPGTPLQTGDLLLDGRLAVVRSDAAGRPIAAYLNGRRLSVPGLTLETAGTVRGTIAAETDDGRILELQLASEPAALDPSMVEGTVLAVEGNGQRALIQMVGWLPGGRLRLTLDRSAIVGRLTIEAADGATASTATTLYPPFRGRDDIGAHLEGAWLVNEQTAARVNSVRQRQPHGHTLEFDGPSADLAGGDQATLVAWRTGASVHLAPAAWWRRSPLP